MHKKSYIKHSQMRKTFTEHIKKQTTTNIGNSTFRRSSSDQEVLSFRKIKD